MSENTIILPPSFSAKPPSKKTILYCDESGNTGPDYLDPNQPFYVLGGWVVPESQSEPVWIAVEELRKRIAPQRDELKSVILKRGEGPKEAVADFFEQLGRLRCFPLYLIAEKKYCVTAKIVETFLDPAFNPLLNMGFTGDRKSKQEIANQLYNHLPDETLATFAQAYRDPDGASLRDALLTVARGARETLSEELATAFMGSEEQIDKIVRAEASSGPFGNVGATLNMPCLVAFLMMAEELGKAGFHRPIRIVHDQHHTYEDGYKKIFKLHQGMPKLFTPMPADGLFSGGLEAVAEFETADSKSRLPIQAADLLSGAIAHLMRIAMNGYEPSAADLRLSEVILPGLLFDEVRVSFPIWSEHCIARVAKSLIMKVAVMPDRPDHEIELNKAVAQAQVKPLLPSTHADRPTNGFALPLPMYGIVGTHSNAMLIVNPPQDMAEDGAIPMVLLFTHEQEAKSFLEKNRVCFDEECEVVAFDGGEIPDLADKLEKAGSVASVVCFDPDEDGCTHGSLHVLVEDLRALFDRMIRLIGSGLDKTVIQRTEIDGREAISMLMSNGLYGAMWAPASRVISGNTREESMRLLLNEDPPVEGLPNAPSPRPE